LGRFQVFFGYIDKKVDQVLESWEKIAGNGPSVIGEDIQKMTLDVLGTCVLGKDFNFFAGSDNGPLYSYNIIFGSLKNISYAFIPNFIIKNAPFGHLKKVRESCIIFDKYLKQMLKERDEKKDDKVSLLKLLVEANNENKLSDEEIRANILVFFVAGHETTSTTLTYILYHLATDQECQEKLRDEVNRVFPNNIEPEGLKDLHYMINVINESLRLNPPAALLQRITTEACELGDYSIPKDTYLHIFIYGLHRDKSLWGEDSNEFNPDRFDKLTKEQSLAFLPFGGGPRICIGNTFSLYEQKIFLSKLMKKFRITLEPGSKLVMTDLIGAPKSELLKFNFEIINSRK